MYYRSEIVEEIRELATLLESGIAEYNDQMKILQSERLKYIRLSMTNGFGKEDGDSKESWLLHLKQLEDSLSLRLRALKQADRGFRLIFPTIRCRETRNRETRGKEITNNATPVHYIQSYI